MDGQAKTGEQPAQNPTAKKGSAQEQGQPKAGEAKQGQPMTAAKQQPGQPKAGEPMPMAAAPKNAGQPMPMGEPEGPAG